LRDHVGRLPLHIAAALCVSFCNTLLLINSILLSTFVFLLFCYATDRRSSTLSLALHSPFSGRNHSLACVHCIYLSLFLSLSLSSGILPLSFSNWPTCVCSGRNACVEHLVGNGALVDDVSGEGLSPLLYAVREGNAAVARTLLESGANVGTVCLHDCLNAMNLSLPPSLSLSLLSLSLFSFFLCCSCHISLADPTVMDSH